MSIGVYWTRLLSVLEYAAAETMSSACQGSNSIYERLVTARSGLLGQIMIPKTLGCDNLKSRYSMGSSYVGSASIAKRIMLANAMS